MPEILLDNCLFTTTVCLDTVVIKGKIHECIYVTKKGTCHAGELSTCSVGQTTREQHENNLFTLSIIVGSTHFNR